MNPQNMLNQFLGQSNQASPPSRAPQGIAAGIGNLASKIPGGLLGGAAAGGVMALLVGNKSARKFVGKAASYGGAAVLGGLALKAYENWQQGSAAPASSNSNMQSAGMQQEETFSIPEQQPADFDLYLVKAMIAAARADGHIDADEQQRIFKAVDQMDLSRETKALLFDLLNKSISVEEIASGANGLEQKTELYLASCLAINPDHPSEQVHLEKLALALQLPAGLAEHLQSQAQQALLSDSVQ
jgi:uncharacterized membrane protein YebE (DUF533 family)